MGELQEWVHRGQIDQLCAPPDVSSVCVCARVGGGLAGIERTQASSSPPASISSTDTSGSSDSRLATTHPAEPPPTTTTAPRTASAGCSTHGRVARAPHSHTHPSPRCPRMEADQSRLRRWKVRAGQQDACAPRTGGLGRHALAPGSGRHMVQERVDAASVGHGALKAVLAAHVAAGVACLAGFSGRFARFRQPRRGASASAAAPMASRLELWCEALLTVDAATQAPSAAQLASQAWCSLGGMLLAVGGQCVDDAGAFVPTDPRVLRVFHYGTCVRH